MRPTIPILALTIMMACVAPAVGMPALPGDAAPSRLAAFDAGLVDPFAGLPPASPVQPAAEPQPFAPEADPLPVGTATPVQTLPPLPSALFLAGFGCLCVALFRGRARLAGLLVAAASVCCAGIGSLPRLVAAAAGGRATIQAPRSDPKPVEDVAHRPVGAEPDRDYVGLLHRLGTAGGDISSAFPPSPWTGEGRGGGESPRSHISNPTGPAVRLAFAQPTAGSVFRGLHVPHVLVLFPHGAACRPDTPSAPTPRRAHSIPASRVTSTSLFARGPPHLP